MLRGGLGKGGRRVSLRFGSWVRGSGFETGGSSGQDLVRTRDGVGSRVSSLGSARPRETVRMDRISDPLENESPFETGMPPNEKGKTVRINLVFSRSAPQQDRRDGCLIHSFSA